MALGEVCNADHTNEASCEAGVWQFVKDHYVQGQVGNAVPRNAVSLSLPYAFGCWLFAVWSPSASSAC